MGELQPIKADFNAKIALKNVFFAIILVRQIHNLGNWHTALPAVMRYTRLKYLLTEEEFTKGYVNSSPEFEVIIHLCCN
jgi:hypothetical protein